MGLTAVDNTADVLWKGNLRPQMPVGTESLAEARVAEPAGQAPEVGVDRALAEQLVSREAVEVVEGMPPAELRGLAESGMGTYVEIAQPLSAKLPDEAIPLDKLDPLLRAKMDEADFYFARFTFSVERAKPGQKVQRVSFYVRLSPDAEGRQPLAVAIDPKYVVREVEHSEKVTVNPSVSFAGFTAALGQAEIGQEHKEFQPHIIGMGEGGANPHWDYSPVPKIELQGVKQMDVVVMAPKGMPEGRARLELTGDINIWDSMLALFRGPIRSAEEAWLSARLW